MMMGCASSALVAMVVVFCVMFAAGNAQTDCSTALSGVAGCVSFLTNPSSTPDQKTCCEPLKTVLSTPTSLKCLCAQATNSQSPTFKNALLLPDACKLDISVSAANCTSTTTTPTPSTTTPAVGTPATPNTTTPAGPGSSGFMSALPYSPFIAAALLFSLASLLL